VIIWFTGLSGSGKSTLAHAVEEELHQDGCRTFVFDGDNVRHGLCANLSFSEEDRHENIRRIGEMSKLFIEAGVIALTAFISPFRVDRERVRALVSENDFIEIYCNSPLELCEERDVKGLYKKARKGEIKNIPASHPLMKSLSILTLFSTQQMRPLRPMLKMSLNYLRSAISFPNIKIDFFY